MGYFFASLKSRVGRIRYLMTFVVLFLDVNRKAEGILKRPRRIDAKEARCQR